FVKFGYNVYIIDVFTKAGVALLCRENKSVGVVISASHNPYQYNGIKFLSPLGTKIPTEIEEKIESAVKNRLKLHRNGKNRKGQVIDYREKAEQIYSNFLIKVVKEKIKNLPVDNLSLVVDCGNGATSKFVPKLFPYLFSNVKFTNIKPDGRNINKNCGATYPENVKDKLKPGQIGISFDGDADRVIFVDEKKNIRDGDYIIGILAAEYKKEKKLKNSLVVVSIMSNFGLLKYLWSKNIKVIQCPVGDRYVSEYLSKYKGNLGGEQAGHIVLYDYLPTGDGILTSLEVLNTVVKNQTSLFKLCQVFTKYPQVLKNVEIQQKPEIDKIFDKKFLQKLEQKIDGRIVLRYSGTEPLFRIMVEGRNKLQIEKVANIIEQHYIKYYKTHYG
ncbi:MAG: phosphoglucosamine mutase, partial [Endomicrobia bacterium]|nr:phosphoglucosamine mutase [Endomicrobiia bacterium]